MASTGPKRFLGISLAFLVSLAGIYYACFRYQLGSPVQAEWWIKNVYQYKDYIADKIDSPKVIIIAGSNALFGIDSGIIEKAVGYPVVNLSAHAELSIGFLYEKIKAHMGEGDIVVMPLEGNYYIRNKLSASFVNNMLAWGWDDYLDRLNAWDLMKFIVSVPKKRIYQGIVKQNGSNPVIPQQKVVARLNRLLASKGAGFRGYNFKSLNRHGDFVAGKKPTQSLLQRYRKGFYYMHDGKICDRFTTAFGKITRLVRKKRGRLILTWPVTVRNRVFDLSRPQYQHKLDRRRRQLAEKFITIHGNPALFNFDVRFFFDTKSHLNRYGTRIRSENLAYCLRRILKDDAVADMGYAEAIRRVRRQETSMLKKM